MAYCTVMWLQNIQKGYTKAKASHLKCQNPKKLQQSVVMNWSISFVAESAILNQRRHGNSTAVCIFCLLPPWVPYIERETGGSTDADFINGSRYHLSITCLELNSRFTQSIAKELADLQGNLVLWYEFRELQDSRWRWRHCHCPYGNTSKIIPLMYLIVLHLSTSQFESMEINSVSF